MDPSKLWDKLHKLNWISKKYQSYHIWSYLQRLVPSKATLSYITSPWETWSLGSCEESKARKQTRKSTGLKSWGSWRISVFDDCELLLKDFCLHISYRIYTHIYIYHIVAVSIYVYHIQYRHLCSLLLLLSPFQRRVGHFFPTGGWLDHPTSVSEMAWNTTTIINLSMFRNTTKKQMHNLVLLSKTSLMNKYKKMRVWNTVY